MQRPPAPRFVPRLISVVANRARKVRFARIPISLRPSRAAPTIPSNHRSRYNAGARIPWPLETNTVLESRRSDRHFRMLQDAVVQITPIRLARSGQCTIYGLRVELRAVSLRSGSNRRVVLVLIALPGTSNTGWLGWSEVSRFPSYASTNLARNQSADPWGGARRDSQMSATQHRAKMQSVRSFTSCCVIACLFFWI